MFDARHLKSILDVGSDLVNCPVNGCPVKVERQRIAFKRDARFYCPEHRIYISSSTFEYEVETENLLWKDASDLALLAAIKSCKRESRMARENSEDALTWNVFRYLERSNLLSPLLTSITGRVFHFVDLIYWSYSLGCAGAWPVLDQARLEFGETVSRGSEPDLICVTNDALFFIEAKFTTSNKTKPGDTRNVKKYLTGGNRWYEQVFASEYETVAVQAQKYELLRFWLLGSWMAAQTDRTFYLLNVVRDDQEKDIKQIFSPHIRTTSDRSFLRLSWEEIYRFVARNGLETHQKTTLMQYFTYKTMGYNRQGELQRAFAARISP